MEVKIQVEAAPEPLSSSPSRVWVGGYTRADGTRVSVHHRNLA
jgi:hypothetical protein